MGFQCGFVGLPNVGKSTLFNALTQTISAQAENYPFCTIEPNIGDIAVPDARLSKIAKINNSAQTIPTRINFIDIAGIVKGAASGEGLGNKFLATIREVDAVIYILRCFEDENITHVHGTIDPLSDLEVIKTELILADLESVAKRLPNLQKKCTGGDKEAKLLTPILEKTLATLEKGHEARLTSFSNEEKIHIGKLHLLTTKPILYVCNVDENSLEGNEFTKKITQYCQEQNQKFSITDQCLIVSAKNEEEIAQLPKEEQGEYLQALGMQSSGLDRIIYTGYKLLDLITYFTAGPKETRAWTIVKGTFAPQAAGVIHTDFEKGFIKAETISYKDFIENNGYNGCKENGKIHIHGKEYTVCDGDIMHFRFNV